MRMDGMDLKTYTDVVREAIQELDGIMKVSLRDQAKDLVKSAMGRSVRPKDPMFWPAGMLMLGLVEARGVLNDAEAIKEIDASIMRHVSLWKSGYKSKIDYIDDALAGVALIKLYEQTRDAETKDMCKSAADRIYDYLVKAPRDFEGTIVYNPGRSAANVFADGVGQTSMFLSIYARVFGCADALELARTQLVNFRIYGCDGRTGLIYHGYSLEKDDSNDSNTAPAPVEAASADNAASGVIVTKKGILSWGRAAGWLIMGLSEYVDAVKDIVTDKNVNRAFAEKGFDKEDDELKLWLSIFTEALWSYQRPDGCFSWQLQAIEGPLDTSATGMILYGLSGGEIDANSRIKALEGLHLNISSGRVLNALSSCDDFGVHYQSYGHYPWGQGAVLAALSRL